MSAAAPEGYPGNPSLPREVRDKILSTFKHTLNLFKEGKRDDCLIGCDFILKMDPRFTPARQLLEKTKNPAADVDVGDLESMVAATPTRQERVASVETDRLLVRAAESFAARDFDAAVAAAEQVLQVLPGNQNAVEIRDKALRKKNAEPQFEVARQRALAALESHRPAEAQSALQQMRSLDPEHPAVALLERKLQPAAPLEVGESTNPGLNPDGPPPPPPLSLADEPEPETSASALGGGGLGDLSLDSLTLDEPPGTVVPPPPGMGDPVTGPLKLGGQALGGGSEPSDSFSLDMGGNETFDHGGSSGAPPDLWSESPAEPAGASVSFSDSAASMFSTSAEESSDSEPSYASASPDPEPSGPSTEDEIATLLQQGDDAARTGNRQQAIEIWSRIFLIDINNSDAVGRIEKARQEMAEGNRRIADSLKQGREKFEAGDFTAAREAFLQVLALDESDQTARTYLDRIEQQLSRPSSGLDLSRRAPQGDVLEEDYGDASPGAAAGEALEEASSEREAVAPAAAAKPPRAPMDKRFLMALGGALILAVVLGLYMWLRPSGGSPQASSPQGQAAAGGPSLEHATALFRDGKVAETIAELKKIPRSSPDYGRAQKLLASLSKTAEGGAGESAAGETAGASGEKPAGAAGPPPEAVKHREEGQKALADKRYIEALKSLSLASASFEGDPTFAQEIGAASEKVNELTPAVKLYNEGEFETAIPILWRIFQADRSNQDARSFLVRSYYNEGIGQLQNGLYSKASESFAEVIAIDPQDADAIRHKKFSERYVKGDLDLLGRIYVRHVQQRP
jgi:tetratricopeptide (TPR) repeat protein